MNRAHRVTFGPGAFLLGAVVTVLLFGVPLGATGYVFGIAAALLLGMPLALATGVVMRPCAAIGRLAVVRLVTTHDDVAP